MYVHVYAYVYVHLNPSIWMLLRIQSSHTQHHSTVYPPTFIHKYVYR